MDNKTTIYLVRHGQTSKVILHNDEMEIIMHGDTTHFKEKPVTG